jgi:beta-N-acetylhexosaminidase
VDRREFADLEPDIRPYRPLIDNNLAGIMAAHVVFPAVDDLPASLSHRWITGVLRGELNFHGCVFADDLTMAGAAAFGDVIERAKLALAAGCDVLPICNSRPSVELVLESLAPNGGGAASQARIVRMRARGETPTDLHANRHWQETAAQIASLSSTPPPLVLTEGQP